MYHFLLSYRPYLYINRKGMPRPLFWCKNQICSSTKNGSKWALKNIFITFSWFFFFKAHFVPLAGELEKPILHQKKGHAMPFPVMWNSIFCLNGKWYKTGLKNLWKMIFLKKNLRPVLYHFPFRFYIIWKGLTRPFFWCKNRICSSTGSGSKRALKKCVFYTFF